MFEMNPGGQSDTRSLDQDRFLPAAVLRGKSSTLRLLAEHLAPGTIPEFLSFEVEKWQEDQERVLRQSLELFDRHSRLAIRSDACSEDQLSASNAGAYLSVLDVGPDGLLPAIRQVIGALPAEEGDRVMVQAMVPDLVLSGVASTHRISDGAPWYCIDFASDDSTAVTGGKASGRHIAVARDRVSQAGSHPALNPMVRQVIELLSTVEQLFKPHPVEIEFAMGGDANGASKPYLLQARPVVAVRNWSSRAAAALPPWPSLGFLADRDTHVDIVGPDTILSMMSDWNPAELLGSHPRSLALSLFRHLISCGTWWRARERLGYMPAPDPDIELLRVVCGRPMVDLRRSANSFLPRGLVISTQVALVQSWLERLESKPELHDKVEFQVFRTVQDFCPDEELRKHQSHGLCERDRQTWEDHLGALTRSMTSVDRDSPLAICRTQIDGVSRQTIASQPWPALLAQAKEGSLVFSMAARIAFAADAQLRSAVGRGALSPARCNELKAAGRSIPGWAALSSTSNLTEGHAHGHLRPGTFDITQSTWAASMYQPQARPTEYIPDFVLTPSETRALQLLLAEVRFPIEPVEWLAFVQRSRQAREWGKYVFSRHLSAAMEEIVKAVVAFGLDRDLASWLTVEQLAEGRSMRSLERQRLWQKYADSAQKTHARDQLVLVSPVLHKGSDLTVSDSLGIRPNFVGQKAIDGKLVVLTDHRARNEQTLRHSIVALRQADPGFDWLFDCGISGLLTAWGGANSHMAVRCAELGLSAAIGCGEAIYARAQKARYARIDPTGGALWLT